MNETYQTIAANYIAMFKGDKERCLKSVYSFNANLLSERDMEIRDEIIRQLFAK